MGQDIDKEYEPLQLGGGYDHNYCLNTNGSDIEKVGELVDDKSGRKMEIYTNMPGISIIYR